MASLKIYYTYTLTNKLSMKHVLLLASNKKLYKFLASYALKSYKYHY